MAEEFWPTKKFFVVAKLHLINISTFALLFRLLSIVGVLLFLSARSVSGF